MEQIQLGKSDMVFCGAGESGNGTAVMFDAVRPLDQYNENRRPPRASTRAATALSSARCGGVVEERARRGSCAKICTARCARCRWHRSNDLLRSPGGHPALLAWRAHLSLSPFHREFAHASLAPRLGPDGELVGYGATADGYDMVAPSGKGDGARWAPQNMADELGGKPVDYVNTHGTSTPVGDVMELKAIKDRFFDLGYQPYVGSTKSITGHAVGAAGVHEAIYSLLMLNKDFLAESINIENIEEGKDMKILRERYDGPVGASVEFVRFQRHQLLLVFDKYTE